MSKSGSSSPFPTSASGRRSGMFYRYDFLPAKHRLHACYLGLWDEKIARDALGAFRAALEGARAGGQPFTLLDDFSGWEVQTREVTATADQFETVWRAFPIIRNAMVIPSASVRMQVRRTLTDFNLSQIFETYDDADKWLAEVERGADR